MKNRKHILLTAAVLLVAFILVFAVPDMANAIWQFILAKEMAPVIYVGTIWVAYNILQPIIQEGLTRIMTEVAQHVNDLKYARSPQIVTYNDDQVISCQASPSPNNNFNNDLLKKLLEYYLEELEDKSLDEFSSMVKDKVKKKELPAYFLVISECVGIVELDQDIQDLTQNITKMMYEPLELASNYSSLEGIINSVKSRVENLGYNLKPLNQAYEDLPSEAITQVKNLASDLINSQWGNVLWTIARIRAEQQAMILKVKIGEIDDSYFPAVITYVSVTDGGDNPVDELEWYNFVVLDNGKKTESLKIVPRSEQRANQRTNIELVFDESPSMNGEPIEIAKEAGKQFIDLKGDNDWVGVKAFGGSVFDLQGLTQDSGSILEAIEGIGECQGTAVYDAVSSAVSTLATSTGRKVVVLLSDGEDNSSSTNLEAAIKKANENGVSVFVIALGSFKINPLQELAKQTGGQLFQAPTQEELKQIYVRINSLVKKEYKLQYLATPDRNYIHRLFVKVNNDNGSGEETKFYLRRKGSW